MIQDVIVLGDDSESDDDVAFIGEARSNAIEILGDGNSDTDDDLMKEVGAILAGGSGGASGSGSADGSNHPSITSGFDRARAIALSSDPPDMDCYVPPIPSSRSPLFTSRSPSHSRTRSPSPSRPRVGSLLPRTRSETRSRTVTPTAQHTVSITPTLSPEEVLHIGRGHTALTTTATWINGEREIGRGRELCASLLSNSTSTSTSAAAESASLTATGTRAGAPVRARRSLQEILNNRKFLASAQSSPPPEDQPEKGGKKVTASAAEEAVDVDGNANPYKGTRGRKRKSDAENVDPNAHDPGLSSEQLARQREQAKRKADKEEEKQAEKEARKLARDTAKAAKEAEKSYQKKIAEVNRLRTTKIDALQELEIHMAHDLSLPTSPIAGALPELRARLDESKSSLHFLSEAKTIVNGSIQFRRHIRATWNPVIKRYVPLEQERLEWESTTVLVASAEDIVDRVSEGDDALITWLADVRLTLEIPLNEQLLLLVRGMEKYHNRTQSIVNRNFRETARAGLAGGQVAALQSSSVTGRVDKAEVEEELLRAQVVQRVFVVHADKTEDIEDWLFNLAGDVAYRPYKLLSKSHLSFSAPEGVRKAFEPEAVLALMLQEVQGLTASAASGITEEHGSFREFMAAYEGAERRGEGEDLVAECQIRSLKNGVPTNRRVGPALSRKVYGIMRGEDPLSLS